MRTRESVSAPYKCFEYSESSSVSVGSEKKGCVSGSHLSGVLVYGVMLSLQSCGSTSVK